MYTLYVILYEPTTFEECMPTMKSVIEWIVAIIIGIAIAWLLTTFVITKYHVSGNSMDPTFKNNDHLIINKAAVKLGRIDRGDVIVFHADQKHDYIKRLIGKPGDSVRYKKDHLYINNHKIEEPYLKENRKHKVGKYLTEDFNVSDLKHSGGSHVVPKGKYLVLGDNRFISNDSRRDLGLIDKDTTVGKVLMRWAPFSEIRFRFYPKSFDQIND